MKTYWNAISKQQFILISKSRNEICEEYSQLPETHIFWNGHTGTLKTIKIWYFLLKNNSWIPNKNFEKL